VFNKKNHVSKFKIIEKVQHRKKAIYEKAMIIEDEEDLSYLLAIILRQNKLAPSCVYSIKEARETINKVKPSFIFLDNHLPDGIGSDFIQHAKDICPSVKIVMITAHDSPAEVDKAFNSGADYFISKPFNSSIIKTTIDYLTTSKQGNTCSQM
jgi:two-component system, OmpR family, response regulator